jgi:hypothetical protein
MSKGKKIGLMTFQLFFGTEAYNHSLTPIMLRWKDLITWKKWKVQRYLRNPKQSRIWFPFQTVRLTLKIHLQYRVVTLKSSDKSLTEVEAAIICNKQYLNVIPHIIKLHKMKIHLCRLLHTTTTQ